MALGLSFLFSGIVVQGIKNFVFAPRPRLFFEQGQYLHFLDGVSMANYASFPSGHTATVFALATVYAIYTHSKLKQLFYLWLAVLVGYSRIYLAQHFLLDVIIGAIIGTATAWLVCYIQYQYQFGNKKSRQELNITSTMLVH